MRVSAFAAVFVGFAAAAFVGGPAQSQSARVFVSAKSGLDNGTCGAVATPCRTFLQAHGNAVSGGEIGVMDPGDYGTLIINKPISIVNEGVGTAGIFSNPTNAPSLISISAGVGGKVVLRGLTLDGSNAATPPAGVFLFSGDLRVERCNFRRLDNGLDLEPSSGSDFTIVDTILTENAHHGLQVATVGDAGRVTVVLKNVKGFGNGQSGVAFVSVNGSGVTSINVNISKSVFAHNFEAGVFAFSNASPVLVTARNVVSVSNGGPVAGIGFQTFGAPATLRVAHSVATGNVRGVVVDGVVETYGDNNLRGNGTNVDGSLTAVSKQ